MISLLPRVEWSSGMVLRPAHFRGLEASLAREAAARFAVAGLPSYGLIEFAWSESTSADGVVAIERLGWLTEDGALVWLGGNATLDSNLALASAGTSAVDVYLHQLDEPVTARSNALDPSSVEGVSSCWTRLALAAQPTLRGASGVPLRLGRFTRTPRGWQYDRQSAPALLSAKRTPFLLDALMDLLREVERVERSLYEGELAPEQRAEERITRQRVRLALRDAAARLSDVLDGEIDPHPYTLFSTLRALSFELEALGNFPAMNREALAYRHREPVRAFTTLLDYLHSQLATPISSPALVRFDCVQHERGPLFVASTIPSDFFSNDADAYVLVLRANRDGEALPRLDLTTTGQVELTVTHRVSAVTAELQLNSAVARRFSPWVDVYRVRAGADSKSVWESARERRELAVVPALLDRASSAFLYWARKEDRP
jgi:predicted component of type VI protein secretion system